MSSPSIADQNANHAFAIVQAMLAQGVRHAVASPGSRNTPLMLALDAAARQDLLHVHVVLDERVAGFIALGIARTTRSPVVLSCTSGSAGGHYLPAIMEADRSHLVLVACTADRPHELQHRGAPQTTAQHALYSAHVRRTLLLPAPAHNTHAATTFAVEQCIADGLSQQGPVHLNLAFREPLWRADSQPIIEAPYTQRAPRVRPTTTIGAQEHIQSSLDPRRPGLIWVGPIDAGSLSKAGRDELASGLLLLSEQWGWPIAADAVSCMRRNDLPVVHHLDVLLRQENIGYVDTLEQVLVIGPWPTSKAFGLWLQRNPHVQVTSLPGSIGAIDPWHRVHTSLPGDLLHGVQALGVIDAPHNRHSNVPQALLIDKAMDQAIGAFCQEHDRFEGTVARALLRAIDRDAIVHVASSMPIRDMDAYGHGAHPHVLLCASRGVNGIDGNIATTAGEAIGAHKPAVLITGDLAFRHDIGALAHLCGTEISLTIVVIDNGGGGIFRHLGIAQHPDAFEPYFLTPQASTIAALGTGCGASVHTPAHVQELVALVDTCLARQGVDVIVWQVPGDKQVGWRQEANRAACDAAKSVVQHDHTHETAHTLADPKGAS